MAKRLLPLAFLLLAATTVVAALARTGTPPLRAGAAQDPAQMPPEIKRIMDKAKRGERPTADELKKLTEWSQKLAGRYSNTAPLEKTPTGAMAAAKYGLGAGIPCKIMVEANWSGQTNEGRYESDVHGNVSLSTEATLYASINGNGAYFADPLNPAAGGSNFRFDSSPTGRGSFYEHSHGHTQADPRAKDDKDQDGTSDTNGTISQGVASLQFFTGGGDALFCLGGIGGMLDGTVKSRTNDGSGEEPAPKTGFLKTVPGLPFPMEKIHGDEAVRNHQGMPVNQPVARVSYNQLVNLIKSGKSGTIVTNESFRVEDNVTGSVTVRILIRPLPVELVVEPANYTKWAPEGGADEATPGNHLVINASLKTKTGGPAPARFQIKKLRFELQKMSHEPGVCGNWPVTPSGGGNAKADYQFRPEDNKDLKVTGEENSVAEATSVANGGKADLASFDWGGWCAVKVTAELSDGNTLTGRLPDGMEQDELIRIPKRKTDSHIADAWRDKADATPGPGGRTVSGLKDDDDSENSPIGDGDPGDGFTLYEEYRGVMMGGKHVRLTPMVKKLCICDQIGGRTADAIDMIQTASGITCYSKFTDEEFGRAEGGSDKFDRSRVMNYNHKEGAHVVDQHGIVILQVPEHLGYAEAHGSGPGPPKTCQYVMITADFSPDEWRTVQRGGKDVKVDYYGTSVAHEIGHTCNLYHHGERDNKQFRIFRATIGGLPAIAAMGTNGQPVAISLIWEESGHLADPTKAFWDTPHDYYFGREHGQHSGCEECLMRYDCADLYRAPDGTFYGLRNLEAAGTILCTSADGTGINRADRRPASRHGTATKGNCAHQLCVNDKYH